MTTQRKPRKCAHRYAYLLIIVGAPGLPAGKVRVESVCRACDAPLWSAIRPATGVAEAMLDAVRIFRRQRRSSR